MLDLCHVQYSKPTDCIKGIRLYEKSLALKISLIEEVALLNNLVSFAQPYANAVSNAQNLLMQFMKGRS